MAQKHFSNRHRCNWLWTFALIVLLLPFTLGQSSAGGCGATVTIPGPDSESDSNDGGDDGETQSEADPAIEEFDDEGVIDDAPGSACTTTYYNEEFGFGFNLPEAAVLEATNYATGFLFTARWSIDTGDGVVLLSTSVQDIHDDFTLISFAEGINQLWREDGATIVLEQLYTLANGKTGHVSIIDNGGLGYIYVMNMLQDGIMYALSATVLIIHFTETTDLLSSESIVSLCVDTGFQGADIGSDSSGDVFEFVPPSPTIIIPLGSAIFADDGQFLGIINTNSFDPDSIANQFGQYGNPFSSISIWNQFGTYGSDFAMLSPWNSFSAIPPQIWSGNTFVAYLTTNSILFPRVHPNDLAVFVGRPMEQR